MLGLPIEFAHVGSGTLDPEHLVGLADIYNKLALHEVGAEGDLRGIPAGRQRGIGHQGGIQHDIPVIGNEKIVLVPRQPIQSVAGIAEARFLHDPADSRIHDLRLELGGAHDVLQLVPEGVHIGLRIQEAHDLLRQGVAGDAAHGLVHLAVVVGTDIVETVELVQDVVAAQDGLAGIDGGQGHAAEAMQVAVLTGQEQVRDLGHDRYLRQQRVVAVLGEAVHGALLDAVEVTDRQRRGRVDVFDAVPEAREHFLHAAEELFGLFGLPGLVLRAAVARGGIGPLRAGVPGHGGRDDHLAGVFLLFHFGGRDAQETAGPLGGFANLPQHVIARHVVLRIVEEAERTGVELDIQRKGRIGIGQAVQPGTVRLGKDALVVQEGEEGAGVDGADVIIGRKMLPALRGHAADGAAFVVHGLDAVPGEDAAAAGHDAVAKGLRKGKASAGETAGAVDVQHRNEGMDIGGRHPFPAAVERVQVGQDGTQARIRDVFGDEGVGRHAEILGVDLHVVGGRPKVEQVHLVGDPVEGVHIGGEVLLLVREIFGQRVDEVRPALGDLIGPAVLGEEDAVGVVRVGIFHADLVPDAQVLADPADAAVLLHAADDVHTRVEEFPEALEALESSPDDGILLDDGDLQPLLRQDGSREKAAQAPAYDDYAFAHESVCSTRSAISASRDV